MKRNLLAIVLTVILNSTAIAQHHHHHHSAGSAVTYPSHYNQNYPYQHPHHVQPVLAFPTYYRPYQPWYPSFGYGFNASRSFFYANNVQNYYPVAQVPQFQPQAFGSPNVVARRPPTPSNPANPEQLAAINRALAPKQLTADQYDRETGQIAWPAALMSEGFASDRTTLEQIFADRANSTDQEWKSKSNDVRRLTSSLRDQLTAQVKDLRPMDFVAAKKFLDGLSREVSSEAGAG